MESKRDGFLDFAKGFLVLWVIHIHTVYFSGSTYLPDSIRQNSLLIDVPIFFFISGYLTKTTGFGIAFKKSLKQFAHLYLNYLLLSCLLLIPLFLLFCIKDGEVPDLGQAIASMLTIHQTGPLWGDLPAYEGSLWYIDVYLSLLPIIPCVIVFCGSLTSRVFVLAALLALYTLSRYCNFNCDFLFTQVVYVFFYLFIFLLGVSYRIDEKRIPTQILKLTFLVNFLICLVVFFQIDHGEVILRSHKFPPSFEYLAHNLLLIQILLLAKRLWNYADFSAKNRACHFLEWCGKNVYFIYLFQGIVCSLPGSLISLLMKNHMPTLGLYLVVILFNVLLTLLLVLTYSKARMSFFNWVENLKTKKGI